MMMMAAVENVEVAKEEVIPAIFDGGSELSDNNDDDGPSCDPTNHHQVGVPEKTVEQRE
jgi:hypothetical protein